MRGLWTLASVVTGGLIRTHGPRTGRAIYLTFDDGPHPVHTPRLLDLLERHGAKAAFYLTGKEAQKHPDLVRRIVAAGHAIGNHSMNHPKMKTLGVRRQWREIALADAVLVGFDGRKRHPFRPPNGRLTVAAIVYCLLRWQRLPLWTRDSLDYKLDAPQVIERLQSVALADGDVILFHDDAALAGQALDTLLPAWVAAGFRFPALR